MLNSSASNINFANHRKAVVRIIEQPASKQLRFRYQCEGRSAGSIPGVNSTTENKTFPSIQILGYSGKAVVVVSCVTKDYPYRPHPHSLVGRDGCRKGVCTLQIPQDTMSITFSNLGIQCVRRKDVESHLKTREEIRVDPFKTGFYHRNQPSSIDLNAVRLCFQVFTEGKAGKFSEPLSPVISDIIYDKKALPDLVIVKISDCESSVDGGETDIILLCEKVIKEDIEIRFFEKKNGKVVWEGLGDFKPSQVHKQTAMWFKAPRYKNLEITEPVKVFIQLLRPSDGATSEPLPFEYLPLDYGIKRRRKNDPDTNYNFLISSNIKHKTDQPYGLNNIPANTVKVESLEQSHTPHVIPNYVGKIIPMYSTIVNQENKYHNQICQSNVPPSFNNVISKCMTNISSTSNGNHFGAETAMSIENSGLTNLLNLDGDQLVQIDLNSDDLSYNTMDINNLSDQFSNNFSINEGIKYQNITDSCTRLAHSTYDNIVGNNIH